MNTIEWYDSKTSSLGDRFLDEFEAALSRIEQFPYAWHLLGKNTRRCRLRHFPYGVIYRIKAEEIVIVALAHLRSEPKQWMKRGEH